MFTKASVVTIFASIAAAQLHAPVGEPSGNAITRPLNEIVPACKPFTITWQPTTPNTVSVLLLKGPATNVIKHGPSLAEGIANSGSLAWTPAATLDATTGPNGYGLQIIDDVTGQYQYSTQFGISKDGCVVASSSAAAHPVASPPVASMPPGYPVASPPVASPSVASSSMAHVPSASKPAGNSPVPTPPHPSKPAATTVYYPTGAPANGTAVTPTGAHTVPSATGSSTPPQFTGAASSLQAGLSFAGAALAVALML